MNCSSRIYRLTAALLMACALMVVGMAECYAYSITFYADDGSTIANNGSTTAKKITKVIVDTNGGSFVGDGADPTGQNWKYYLWQGNTKLATTNAVNGVATFNNLNYALTENSKTSFEVYNEHGGDKVANFQLNVPEGISITQLPSPSLVLDPPSSNGVFCKGQTVYVIAKNVGGTYTNANWKVSPNSGSLSYNHSSHTLELTGLEVDDKSTSREYTVTLTTDDGDLSINFTVLDPKPLNRTFTLCASEFQMNATLPEGFTGSWTGSGVVDVTSPTTMILNPNGDYFWTANNGTCSFQETWTINNSNPDLSKISVVQTGGCGEVELSVKHNKGYPPTWTVDGGATSVNATASENGTKSTISITAAGTHSVTVTAGPDSPAGCKQTEQTSVTVTSSSDFSSDEVTTTVCTGSATTLSAPTIDGATSQQWSIVSGSGTILPNKSSSSVNISGLAEGKTNVFEWKVEKDGCTFGR